MTDRRDPMDEIDALLTEAARAPLPELSPTLEARLLHDAERLMPDGPSRRRSGLTRLLRGLGGWPAVGGFATAAAAGVWIGLTAPGLGIGLAADAVTVSIYQDMTLAGGDG